MKEQARSNIFARGLSRRRFIVGAALTAAVGVVAVACSAGGTTVTTTGGAAAQTGGALAQPVANGAASQATTVTMNDALKFDPAVITVPKGTTVEFKNASSSVHTVTCDPSKAAVAADAVLPSGAQPFDSGVLNPGQSFKYTFDVAGDYTYFCIPHETVGMIGKVKVT